MNTDLVTILVIAVIAVGAFYIMTSTNVIKNEGEINVTEGTKLPNFKPDYSNNSKNTDQTDEGDKNDKTNIIKHNTQVLPYPQISNKFDSIHANIENQFNIDTGKQPKIDCFPKDTITPQELMPTDDPHNTWQLSSPSVNGSLSDRNFLESGYHFGIDTVSNTLKNPNLQLRSDPVIPQMQVGPWMQSTIGPDTNHKQFEIGGDY
jgi:hypothetical protein